jgi:SAM-dependent methyltransferase
MSATSMEKKLSSQIADNETILAICKTLLVHTALDKDEAELIKLVEPARDDLVDAATRLVAVGKDPLGDAYMRLNALAMRREFGAVYTPHAMVGAMVRWAKTQISPKRVVDCGCGSGRFAVAAAREFRDAHIIAVDSSPFATLMCKAHAIAAGVGITVLHEDFMTAQLPLSNGGPILWLGNPPYVRHHNLSAAQKTWLIDTLAKLGVRGNRLAGLHTYFMASVAERFSEGDVGCLVMSAEWMDTGYGVAIRDLLTKRLGMTYLRVYDKAEEPFEGTMTSAVVAGFSKRNAAGAVEVNGKEVALSDFARASRWSDVISGRHKEELGEGFVRLGDFARVHRGVVTGKNSFWVRKPGDVSEELCVPVVSHAKELSGDVPACRDVRRLSRLITLPDDLAQLPTRLRDEAQAIVDDGLRRHVNEGFVASHRKCWWSVKAPEPPAIMMTYMARHPPVFVVNRDRLGMLNVVHGIYPTVALSERAVERLVSYLNDNVALDDGRVYAGGLAKFEPREVERLIVPSPERLDA